MAGLFGPGHPWFGHRKGRRQIASDAVGWPMDGRDKKGPGHDGQEKGGSVGTEPAQAHDGGVVDAGALAAPDIIEARSLCVAFM
jgi:hypothetical protein